MAKLSELLTRGQKCKAIVTLGGHLKFRWDGWFLHPIDAMSRADDAAKLLDERWELEEPTVDSVLKERGWQSRKCEDFPGMSIIEKNCLARPALILEGEIKTPAEATRICDFLDSLKS